MLSGYVARPFRLYAAFRGRSSRREFLCFTIMMWTSMLAAIGIGGAFDGEGGHNWTVGLFLIVMLAFITPALAVKVRRVHDFNASGWWVLASGVPYLGFLVELLFAVMPGTAGENDFGPDPRTAANVTA